MSTEGYFFYADYIIDFIVHICWKSYFLALISRYFRAGFALDFRILVAEFSLSRIAARCLGFFFGWKACATIITAK